MNEKENTKNNCGDRAIPVVLTSFLIALFWWLLVVADSLFNFKDDTLVSQLVTYIYFLVPCPSLVLAVFAFNRVGNSGQKSIWKTVAIAALAMSAIAMVHIIYQVIHML